MYQSHPDRNLLEQALTLGVRGLDTAFNYRGFTSHTALARTAGDLLTEFTLSTKVGFFPTDGPTDHVVHSLDPRWVRDAIEQSAEDLGRTPDVVFLHNPERSLTTALAGPDADRLAAACRALRDAAAAGLCTRWGIASWDPRPVVTALPPSADVRPDVLLVRSGLSVAEPVLRAAEQLAERCAIPPAHRWGMSPFGGNADNTAWHGVSLDAFLCPGQRSCSTLQAAFRVAYALPEVTQVAVGTRSAAHLRELVDAVDLRIETGAVARYRNLIRTADSQ